MAKLAHRRSGERRRLTSVFLCLAFGWLISLTALADGCFVFKWNKAIDINEPTQKAIIVHDAGREDLLLQVKYEGLLEEFGWLIPVPSFPKVEEGSMEPFYELSELTQRQFESGGRGAVTMSLAGDSPEKPVKVIVIKTVGAYEVAVLSAQDTDSLARWLKAHDYSLPDGKSEIVDDYIRRGWYFIAAKIHLNKGVAFKPAASTSPRDADDSSKTRNVLQKKLSTGELHPLLISFDTPKCVFPLKISAMSDNPSQVSLYILSQKPLLERFTFDKACEKINQSHAEWTKQKPERSRARSTSYQNTRSMQLAWMMYAQNPTNRTAFGPRGPRNWSTEDLTALAKETQSLIPEENLGEVFYAAPEEMLHRMQLESGKIPKCTKALPRLKERDWQLTKVVWTFAPAEMHDLEFAPAISALKDALPTSAGGVAAQLLVQMGGDALPPVLVACKSTNALERLNAICGLVNSPNLLPSELLLPLLKDESPAIRFHAVRLASYSNRDQRFTQPMIELLRDDHSEISQDASGWLANHEDKDRTSFYLSFLNDSNPTIRMHGLGIASALNWRSLPPDVVQAALRALKDQDELVQRTALFTLAKCNEPIPKADLFPLLINSHGETAGFAANLLRWGGRIRHVGETAESDSTLSSAEAGPLMTNRFGSVRLLGLRLMQDNADATAIELTLPLLKDPNSVVRSSAFATMQAISGKTISETDAAKWEAWWTDNKTSFTPRPAAQ